MSIYEICTMIATAMFAIVSVSTVLHHRSQEEWNAVWLSLREALQPLEDTFFRKRAEESEQSRQIHTHNLEIARLRVIRDTANAEGLARWQRHITDNFKPIVVELLEHEDEGVRRLAQAVARTQGMGGPLVENAYKEKGKD